MKTSSEASTRAAITGFALGWAFLTSAAQAGLFSADFNDNQVPAATALYGDQGDGNAGVIEDGILKLTKPVANQNGGFIIEDLDEGVPISGFTATFKMFIGGGSGADGLSFNFAPDLPDSPLSIEGAGSGLSICFDTYQNTGEVAPAIDLKSERTTLSSVTGLGPVFRKGEFVDVWIQVKSDNTLSMTVGNTVVFTNFYGAFIASAGRFGFGAGTGGTQGDHHWIDDLRIETLTEPATEPAHPLVIAQSPTGGGVPAEPLVHVEIKDFTTEVNPATVKLLFNNGTVEPTVAKVGEITTVDYDPPGVLPPLSAHSYILSFEDNGTPAHTTRITYSFTTANYRSAVLPAPLYLETFDSTEEGELPGGWTQTNATTSINAYLDLDDPRSDSYLGWTVVDRSRFQGFPFDTRRLTVSVDYLNGVLITNLIDGKCAFAASDPRAGNQIQVLFSPDFDLRGKTNIHLAYNSIYTQNQDSMGAVEYSIDQGASWLPVIYMLDDSGVSGGFDIVRGTNALGQVFIDGEATFTKPQEDTPLVEDGMGGTRRTFWYEFIEARPLDSLGPYIEGRFNDDQEESKRFEVFRLPQADNQATVRFRFVQVGTTSWYYGIDNFGLYSVPSPQIRIVRAGDSVVISWEEGAAGSTLQSTAEVVNPQWTTVAVVAGSSLTLPIGTGNQFFRLIR